MNDIILKNITKRYDDRAGVFDFSGVFKAGKVTAIMGPSGCGKTTVLRILAGLEKQDSGEICGAFEKISYVFQSDRLCPDFTAVANVMFVTGKSTDRATVEADLGRLGLSDSLHKPVSELSGGMKRRVAIARALIYESDFVILDEPFKGLDEELRLSVMEYVKDKAAGRTVVLVTHDEEEAKFFGGEIIRMSNIR